MLVFGLLLGTQGELLLDDVRSLPDRAWTLTGALGVGNRFLTVAFLSMVWIIYSLRPPAARTNRTPWVVAVAFLGTFFLFTVRFLPSAGAPTLVALLLGDLLLGGGLVFSLYSLATLRSSFSLVPEARRLVTAGPYRWVRHPLYLGETMSGFGLILPGLSPLSVGVFAVYLAAQLTRMHMEERMLQAEFPDYAAWARRTRRLVPFIY
jgi:protein-S-isoprenylcysteine O-methyltransferase Ste14